MQEKSAYKILEKDALSYQISKIHNQNSNKLSTVVVVPDSKFLTKPKEGRGRSDDNFLKSLVKNLTFFLPDSNICSVDSGDYPIYSNFLLKPLELVKDIASLSLISTSASKRFVLCVDPLTLCRLFPAVDVLLSRFTVNMNGEEKFENLLDFLHCNGYEKRNNVYEALEYAARGSIVDIGTISGFFRVEFVGNLIERISIFDIHTQRRTSEIETLSILRGGDIVLNSDTIKNFTDNLINENCKIDNEDLELVKSGMKFLGMQNYLPLFFEDCKTSCIFDFLPEKVNFITCYDSYDEILGVLESKISKHYNDSIEVNQDEESIILPKPHKVFLESKDIKDKITNRGSNHIFFSDYDFG